MDKISIIVPIYNVSKYLDECILSILNQTYIELEIILVNDGSTDNSLEICERYQKKDQRVKLINQINSGHGSALNNGINQAIGAYIMFCDGDDFYLPSMVEMLYQSIKRYKTSMSSCVAMAFDNESRQPSIDPYHSLIRIPYQNNDVLNKAQILNYAMEFAVQYWAKIYDARWLKTHKIGFPSQKMSYDDIAFHWWALAEAESISLVRAQLYGYRLNRPGASFTHLKQMEYLAAYKIAEEVVLTKGVEFLESFYQSSLNDWWWVKKSIGLDKLVKPKINQWWMEVQKSAKLSSELRQNINTFLLKNKWPGI